MPDYKMHWFVGLAITIAIIIADYYFRLGLIGSNYIRIGILIAITLLYSILPDIDTGSKVRNIVLPFALILAFILLLIGDKIVGLIIIATLIAILALKHRGITHRYWFALLIALPLLFFNGLNFSAIKVQILYYIIAIISYDSHLALDGIKVK